MKSYTITVNGNVMMLSEETGATPSAPVKAAAPKAAAPKAAPAASNGAERSIEFGAMHGKVLSIKRTWTER
ncbi:MAG: hypothetical protein ACLT2Z_09305 [Eubacterium sp.]